MNELVAPWASILLGLRCFGTMPPIQPNKAEAPIPHSIHAIGFALLFSGFKAAVRHHVRERIRGPLGLNPAGVPLFRNHASNPTKEGRSSHPTLYPRHRFCFALAVSKLPFGTTSANEFVARGPSRFNPAGVPLFRNHASNPTKECRSSHPTLYPRQRFCFAFSGFEAAVRHHVRERIRGPLGLNPAGVPLFRNHASNPTKEGRSSHPTLYPRHRFCFAFSGFEAAVRHHVCERIRGPLGLNPAGVPLFRNHASNPTKECRSSHLYPRHRFCFAFSGFEAAVRHHVCERIHGPLLGLKPAGVPLFRNHASNPTKECRSSAHIFGWIGFVRGRGAERQLRNR